MSFSNLSKTFSAFVLGFSMLSISTLLQAENLDLSLEAHPHILSQYLDVTYTAGTDSSTVKLVVSGHAMQLSYLKINNIISARDLSSPGTFNLSTTVNDSGTFTGGVFIIGGTIASL